MPEQQQRPLSASSSLRRSYEPPQVARVPLATDEVLSTGCKTQLGGTYLKGETFSCYIESCAANGS